MTRRRAAAALLIATLSASAALAHVGRPIYSEPGAGVSLPPGCMFEPSWRSRLANSDLELWVVECTLLPHLWLVRRGAIEYDRDNRARMRFQVIDERKFPGETAGETVSIQCSARGSTEAGYAVIGAAWKSDKGTLRLQSAKAALRVQIKGARLIDVPVAEIECNRFLEREETMRRLQQDERGRR